MKYIQRNGILYLISEDLINQYHQELEELQYKFISKIT